MIEKIKEDAYVVIDNLSFISSLASYDPMVANQTICFDQEFWEDTEEPE